MIKILKIASISAAAIGALFLVLSIMFGLRQDKAKAAFLAQPGVIENFKAGARNHNDADAPLVKQAQMLSLRINPPAPVKPVTVENARPVFTAQFKLLGTSYYPDEPARSVALIDDPGKGWRWVAKSEAIGSAVVSDITDGKLTYKEGDQVREMLVEHTSQIVPLISTVVASAGSTAAQSPVAANVAAAQNPPPQEPAVQKEPTKEELQENAEFLKKIVADLRDPNNSQKSAEDAASAEELGKFIKEIEAEAAAIDSNKPASDDANSAQPGNKPVAAPDSAPAPRPHENKSAKPAVQSTAAKDLVAAPAKSPAPRVSPRTRRRPVPDADSNNNIKP